MTRLQAFRGWYIVRPAEFSQELESGLVLPDIAKGKSCYGLVLASPPEGPNLDGKIIYCMRSTGLEYMREVDDKGRPDPKTKPYLSVMAAAVHGYWDVKPEDLEHVLNAPQQAIDHDAEKDNRNRIVGAG